MIGRLNFLFFKACLKFFLESGTADILLVMDQLLSKYLRANFCEKNFVANTNIRIEIYKI